MQLVNLILPGAYLHPTVHLIDFTAVIFMIRIVWNSKHYKFWHFQITNGLPDCNSFQVVNPREFRAFITSILELLLRLLNLDAA